MTLQGTAKTGQIISPIDGKLVAEFPYLNRPQAQQKIDLAVRTQKDWCKVDLDDRIRLCRAMLEGYQKQLDNHAESITKMMGKPIEQARSEFTGGFCDRVNYLCEIAPSALQETSISLASQDPELDFYITREPLGVVLDIAAWNYPLLVAVNIIVPAVLAGNSVLIKHAPQTALVADQLEKAFLYAGAPPGLVQSFMIDHDLLAPVLTTDKIAFVGFTGSVLGGREVNRQVAAHSMAQIGLELGGKDPAIVLDDCDFDSTVENLVDGTFYNAGQSCCAVERIYVQSTIFDQFVEAFVERTYEYRLDNPLESTTTLGPVVNELAAQRIVRQIQDALNKGARQVSNDAHFKSSQLGPCYLPPRVLIHVDHSMLLMQEESFAPVIGIMPFENEEQSISYANDSKYGLTASVWTNNCDRGKAILRSIHAGTVYLNRCDAVEPSLPWSGVKHSGIGATLSHLGFTAITRPKSFNLRINRP